MKALRSIIRLAAAPVAALVLASACSDQGAAGPAGAVPVNPVLTDVVLGQTSAPVEIIEYASYTCPHCRDFWKQDFPRLKAAYIDTGKVKYIYRDFPTDPNLAPMLVSVARCKGAENYYDVVDDIFSNQIELFEAAQQGRAGPLILALGQRHGASEAEIRTCLTHKGINDALNKQIEEGRARGVDSTPAVFINGVRAEDHSFPALSAAIDKALGVAPSAPATETPAAPAAGTATTPAAPGQVPVPTQPPAQ
jgi:protein-disulfide isomerase